MAERARAIVYGPNGSILHTEENVQHIAADDGVLVVSGPTVSVIWAPGFWANLVSERING